MDALTHRLDIMPIIVSDKGDYHYVYMHINVVGTKQKTKQNEEVTGWASFTVKSSMSSFNIDVAATKS